MAYRNLLALVCSVALLIAGPAVSHAAPDVAQAAPDGQGTLNVQCKPGERTLSNGRKIQTAIVLVSPPAPIAGQLKLQPGDEIFAVDGKYFSALSDMDMYVRSLAPGSNVKLDYFGAGVNGRAVSGIFPVAGPGGYPGSNGVNTRLVGLGLFALAVGAIANGPTKPPGAHVQCYRGSVHLGDGCSAETEENSGAPIGSTGGD